jgi:hypothetical protein
MEKLIVTFKLRDGVTVEQYSKWSYEVDQRTALQQDACTRFELYAIEDTVPAVDGGKPSPEIMESIEITDADAWQAALKTDAMKRVLAEFGELVDESTVKEIRGSRVV